MVCATRAILRVNDAWCCFFAKGDEEGVLERGPKAFTDRLLHIIVACLKFGALILIASSARLHTSFKCLLMTDIPIVGSAGK